MVSHLRHSFFDYDTTNFCTALCVGFAAFLRAGEFTWDQWDPLSSPRFRLSRKHITFNIQQGSATLFLPASKTDPYAKGTEIHLPPTGTEICPVAALSHLFERFPSHADAPLFNYTANPFSRSHLVDRIKLTLLKIGIDTSKYSGHSLRKGAAVSASQQGISRAEIQLLGRWKSDAVDIYINEVTKSDHQAKMLNLRSCLLARP